MKIVEEKNPVSSEEMIDQNVLTSTDISYASHRFKNFKDVRIFQTIKKICYSIAKYAEFNIVIDYLLEIFLSSSVHRKETVLFLNEVLRCRIEIEGILLIFTFRLYLEYMFLYFPRRNYIMYHPFFLTNNFLFLFHYFILFECIL